MPLPRRWPLYSLIGFAVLYGLMCCVSYAVPVNHDELAYALMARDFGDHGSFYYENPSYWSFYIGNIYVRQAMWFTHYLYRLPSQMAFQYPALGSVLAYPFYKLFAYDGLLLLNALSFLLTLWLIYKLALLLFSDRTLAALSCIVFVLGTYSWFYSRTMLVHTPTIALSLAASYCAIFAYLKRGEPRALKASFAAGALIGAAAGIRYDALLTLPAMLMPFFFTRPLAKRHLGAMLAGPLAFSVLYTIINYYKFDVVHPFTYGVRTDIFNSSFLPFLLGGAFAVSLGWGAWWITTSPRFAGRLPKPGKGTWLALLAIIFLLTLALLWAMGTHKARRWGIANPLEFVATIIGGILHQALDGRIGIERFYTGASSTIARMALLQSCPHLMLLIWFFLSRDTFREHKRAILLLALVPVIYIGVIGGMNLYGFIYPFRRFLLPVFPYTSILVALVLTRILRAQKSYLWLLPLFLITALLVWVDAGQTVLEQTTLANNDFPLWLAGCVAIGIFALPRTTLAEPKLQWIMAAIITVTFAWTSALAGSLYMKETALRKDGFEQYEVVRTLLPEGSMVVTKEIAANQLYLYLQPDMIFIQPTYKSMLHIRQAWALIRKAQEEGIKTFLFAYRFNERRSFSDMPLTLIGAKNGMLLFTIDALPYSLEELGVEP